VQQLGRMGGQCAVQQPDLRERYLHRRLRGRSNAMQRPVATPDLRQERSLAELGFSVHRRVHGSGGLPGARVQGERRRHHTVRIG
jgi:hypothetical protein